MDNQSVFYQENNMDRTYKIMEGTGSDDGLLNCGLQQATEEKMRIFFFLVQRMLTTWLH